MYSVCVCLPLCVYAFMLGQIRRLRLGTKCDHPWIYSYTTIRVETHTNPLYTYDDRSLFNGKSFVRFVFRVFFFSFFFMCAKHAQADVNRLACHALKEWIEAKSSYLNFNEATEGFYIDFANSMKDKIEIFRGGNVSILKLNWENIYINMAFNRGDVK